MFEFSTYLIIETLEEFEKITKVYDGNRYFYKNSFIKKPSSFPAYYEILSPYYNSWCECSKDDIYNELNHIEEKIKKIKNMIDR